MCIGGISLDDQFYFTTPYQLVNESRTSASTRIPSQLNPCTKAWAEKLCHIGNTNNEFTRKKWESYPALLDAIVKSDHSKHFINDESTYTNILLCQQKISEIGLCVIGEILALPDNSSAFKNLSPELREKIKDIQAITDLVFNTLLDIKKSDRIINGGAPQKGSLSTRTIVGIVLSSVGIILASLAFLIPLAFPALAVPALLNTLGGLRLLLSGTEFTINIYDVINKRTHDSTDAEKNEFIDALSTLHDYLNEIKYIGMTTFTAGKSTSLNDHKALPPETKEQHDMLQQEIRQMQITLQQLRKEIEDLKYKDNMPSASSSLTKATPYNALAPFGIAT